MASSSRKKTRTSAGDAMKLIAKPEPALTYAARDSFAFSEGAGEPPPESRPEPAPVALPVAASQDAKPASSARPSAAKPSFAKPPFADPAALFGKGLGALGSGNVEAVAQAGAILAKGLEEMSQSVVSLGQRNLESSLNLAKAAIGTTTLRQFVDLQTGYARDSFDRLVAEGQKLQEMSLKTANAALQPLQARMAATMGTLAGRAA